MKITEEWLKEQGWKVNHYNIPELEHKIFHYATKMFGKDMVEFNDKKQVKIFRDYEEPCDVYADVLIDNVDTVEKLYQSLDLCGLYDFKEYDWLHETWLDKACRWLVEHTHDAAALGNITCTSVMTEGTLIEDFRKAMDTLKEPLNTTE